MMVPLWVSDRLAGSRQAGSALSSPRTRLATGASIPVVGELRTLRTLPIKLALLLDET
jgi:hypothetical protein